MILVTQKFFGVETLLNKKSFKFTAALLNGKAFISHVGSVIGYRLTGLTETENLSL